MRNHPFILAFSLLWLTPGLSLADGMMMTSSTSGTAQVQATEQRAVLWLRDGAWEIHIQPVFDREQADSAWVVPFPVRPEVSESSHAFLNELEILTSPVFVKHCYSHVDAGSGGMDGGSSSGGGSNEADAHVHIWEEGTVGDLDFVVLSADEGSYLVMWLEENGYQLPEGAPDLIAEMETEEQFFFVARVSADADPQAPLQPVRFRLPCLCAPLYPLRLTSLGVTGDQKLELTLWVIFKSLNDYWKPRSHPSFKLGLPTYALANGDEYQAELDDFFERNPPGSLAILYGGKLSKRIDDRGVPTSWGTVTYESMGIELPYTWSEEIRELRSDSYYEDYWWTFRYQARMDAESMDRDLVFLLYNGNDHQYSATNVWVQDLGYCNDTEEYPPPVDGGPTDAGPDAWPWDAGKSDAGNQGAGQKDGSGGCSIPAGPAPLAILLWLALFMGVLGLRARQALPSAKKRL